MKKYILSILSLLFLNTVYSQVLYDETFDNYTLGNLGTDPDGIISGQGGWYTLTYHYKDNNNYRIVNEPNKGKVLEMSSTPGNNHAGLRAFKSLNYNINQRTPGNNVIKFQIDYYTGPQQPLSSGNHSRIDLYSFGNHLEHSAELLCQFYFDKNDGSLNVYSGGGYLSFNTWYRVIMYLDYDNKKTYLQIPNAGSKVFVNPYFLVNVNSSNIIEDFKPVTIELRSDMTAAHNWPNPVMRSKYDNIKITALNAVPPHILSVNTILAEQFNLYPNPATNVVNITNSENIFVEQVTVYDVTGKQLSVQTFNNESEIQLNVENLASGVYLLHIETNEGTAVKKLVKK